MHDIRAISAMFQMRVEPRYEIMRKMIRAGDLERPCQVPG